MARLKPHVNKSRTLMGLIVFSYNAINFGCQSNNCGAAMTL
jgi:hypothetical protein